MVIFFKMLVSVIGKQLDCHNLAFSLRWIARFALGNFVTTELPQFDGRQTLIVGEKMEWLGTASKSTNQEGQFFAYFNPDETSYNRQHPTDCKNGHEEIKSIHHTTLSSRVEPLFRRQTTRNKPPSFLQNELSTDFKKQDDINNAEVVFSDY